ncbi:ankyrin [Thermothelomyces heterothallicus CBS 203.75]
MDSHGSPRSSDIAQVAPSLPFPWPEDDPCPEFRSHYAVTNRFVSAAFPEYQTQSTPQMFSRDAKSPTFSHSEWIDNAEALHAAPHELPSEPPSHGYHAPMIEAPSSLVDQQMPQRVENFVECGLGSAMPGFSGSHTSLLDHGVVEAIPLGCTNPIYGATEAQDMMLCTQGHTPLHYAVIGNDLQKAKSMLHAGASPNSASRNGTTPLHYAAYQRNVEMVKLLLDYGASLDATTDKKRSVLFFAVRSHGQLDSSDLLIYGDSTMTASNPPTDDDTVRIINALFNSPTRWRCLLRSLNKSDKDGVTPLMVAARGGFGKTATLLLERGAQPDQRDHSDHTALKYAAMSNHRDLVRLLLLADEAVSSERKPSHILKLASKNIPTSELLAQNEQETWGDSYFVSSTALLAEEIVRLCQEMGMLDGLLDLACRKSKLHLLELFRRATRQLDIETSHGNGS